MLKKTIKYKNLFTDEEVEEDFYFHLSKAELIELEFSHKGGMKQYLENIIAAKDEATLIQEFKKIILMSYGKKSEDGRQHVKNQEVRDEFVATEAYSALFMEFVTDTDKAIEFITGVFPSDMVAEAQTELDQLRQDIKNDAEAEPKVEAVQAVPEVETISRAELELMPHEEFQATLERAEKGEIKIAD